MHLEESDWAEIQEVFGHKIDAITRTVTYVSMFTVYGATFEMTTDEEGFEAMAAEISRRFPGIDPNWLEKIVALKPGEKEIVVWTRTTGQKTTN